MLSDRCHLVEEDEVSERALSALELMLQDVPQRFIMEKALKIKIEGKDERASIEGLR